MYKKLFTVLFLFFYVFSATPKHKFKKFKNIKIIFISGKVFYYNKKNKKTKLKLNQIIDKNSYIQINKKSYVIYKPNNSSKLYKIKGYKRKIQIRKILKKSKIVKNKSLKNLLNKYTKKLSKDNKINYTPTSVTGVRGSKKNKKKVKTNDLEWEE